MPRVDTARSISDVVRIRGSIGYVRVPVQPSRKGGRRFPVSLLLLDAVCYDEQLLLRDTHPQRAPCREKDESVLSLYIAIYRPNL